MYSYERFSIFPTDENDVKAVTKNVNTVISTSISKAFQQVSNQFNLQQELHASCNEEAIAAYTRAQNECIAEALEKKNNWTEAEIKDLCVINFCEIGNINQNQVLNVNAWDKQKQTQKQATLLSIQADLNNKIAGIPGGGCKWYNTLISALSGTSCKSVTKNEIDNTSKSVTTQTIKSVQDNLLQITQTQEISAQGVSVKNITQEQAMKAILQAVQDDQTLQTSVKKIATKISSNLQAQKSGIAMLIIIIVLVILLIVVGYFFYKWWKKRKASGGFSRRSTRSLAKNSAKR